MNNASDLKVRTIHQSAVEIKAGSFFFVEECKTAAGPDGSHPPGDTRSNLNVQSQQNNI